jgi:hypothetical protein
MNATPSHEPERAEFARLLPAPGYPELPADRQLLLKEDLMSHLSDRPPLLNRKRLGLSLGLGMPLAVGAAVLALTLPGTGSPAAPSAPAPVAPHAPARVVNAAYSLDLQKGDEIKVTVHRNGAKVDGAQLKKDLARLGVNAQVSRELPHCWARLYTLATPSGGNDYAFTFKRSYLSVSSLVAFFPMGPPPKVTIKGNTATATGGGKGDFLTVSLGSKPTCMRPTK